MAEHKKSHVARTAAVATKLGHHKSSKKPSAAVLKEGIHFSAEGSRKGSICFAGPCDPKTGMRFVSYRDANGSCSDLREVPCSNEL